MAYITIKEAAERLGVSEKTARRMVKDGRLNADSEKAHMGDILHDEAEIRTAQEITEVVPVNRLVAVPDLVNTIAARLDGKLSEAISTLTKEVAGTKASIEDLAEKEAQTRAEIEALRQELAATRELLKEQDGERRIAEAERDRLLEERDRRLVEEMRQILQKRRRPWWRFW